MMIRFVVTVPGGVALLETRNVWLLVGLLVIGVLA